MTEGQFIASDTTAPELDGISLTGPSVDAATGQASVQIQAEISDVLAGFSYGGFRYEAPEGNQSIWLSFDRDNLIQGDANSGTVLVSANLPVNAAAGTWSLNGLELRDQAQNSISYWGDDLAALVSSLGLSSSATSFVVVNSTGDFEYLSDSDEPVPLDIRLGATTLDLSSGASNLPIQVDFSDDVSGLREFRLSFRAPSGSQQTNSVWLRPSENLLSGDSLDGTLAGSFLLPDYAEEGRWSLSSISVRDNAGNSLGLWDSSDPNSDDSLAAYGFGDISFVAGDVIEWDRKIVFEGGSATATITAANQQPGTDLYYTLSGEGDAITDSDIEGGIRSGWITLDANKQAQIPITVAKDGNGEGDELLYIDVFTDDTESWAVGQGVAIRIADSITTILDLSKTGKTTLAANALWSDASGLSNASLTFKRINTDGGTAGNSGSGYFSGEVRLRFDEYESLLANSQAPDEQHIAIFAGNSQSAIKEPGIYELTGISFNDHAGNYRWYNSESSYSSDYDHSLESFLEESGLNASLFRFEATGTPPPNTAAGDKELPELTAFSWSESIRELEDGSGILQANARFEDESGLDDAYFHFRSGANNISLSFRDWETRKSNDSNTIQDHVAWLHIPFNTEAGDYELVSISLDDKANNYQSFSGNSLTEWLEASGLTADQFRISIPDGWPKPPAPGIDLDPPTISALSIQDRNLDLSTGEGLIVNGIFDDPSGFDYGSLRWQKEGTSNWEDSISLSFSEWKSLVAFDPDGKQHAAIIFPRRSNTAGTYQLSSIWLSDTKGNNLDLSGSALATYLAEVSLDPEDLELTLTGSQPDAPENPVARTDQEAPTLNNFNLSTLTAEAGAANTIDIAGGDQGIRIELGVEDDLSGFIGSDNDQYVGEIELLHSNGIDRIWTSLSTGDFKSTGNGKGIFTIDIPVDNATKNGLWNIVSLSVRDLAGNWRSLDAASYDNALSELSREQLAQRLGLANGKALGIMITGGNAEGNTEIPDYFAPRIESASFDQSSIDLSEISSTELILSLQINQDDLAVIQAVVGEGKAIPGSEAWIVNSLTGERIWSETVLRQGKVEATFDLDSSTTSGTWALGGIDLAERSVNDEWSGGGYFLPDQEKASLGTELIAIRLDLEPASIKVDINNPSRPGDALAREFVAPLLTNARFESNEVSLSDNAATITLNLSFEDQAGLDFDEWIGEIELISSDGNQSVEYNLIESSSLPTRPNEASIQLVEGNPTKGKLAITIPLGQWLQSGQWLLKRISAWDKANNERSIELLVNGDGYATSAETGSGYFDSTGVGAASIQQLAARLGSSADQLGFTILNGQSPETITAATDTAAPIISGLRISRVAASQPPSPTPPTAPITPPTPPITTPPAPLPTEPVSSPSTPVTTQPVASQERPPVPEAAKSIEGLKTLAATINLDSIKEQNPTLETSVLKVLEDLQNDSLITRDPGAGKKDPITGTQTDDTMIPPSGRGVLSGGKGADNFAFIEADKFGKRGADRITDFKPAEGDKIVLSDAVFTGLSEIKFTSVRSKAGLKKALRSDATIIYDQSTGSIYFDGNGDLAGQGSGGLFAVLNGRPKLTAADFSLLQTSTLQV